MTHTSTLTLETDVAAKQSLAETAYAHIKASIFDFELLPGDRFSETEIAERLKMSRTPVRDALYRLERERYLQVHLRLGWSVRPYDFSQFEDLYDLRLILEEASVVPILRPGGAWKPRFAQSDLARARGRAIDRSQGSLFPR